MSEYNVRWQLENDIAIGEGASTGEDRAEHPRSLTEQRK